MQGTRKPILPVHSDEEKKLFSKLMREHPGFNRVGTGPIWQEAVKIWNRLADENLNISYKVCLLLISSLTF